MSAEAITQPENGTSNDAPIFSARGNLRESTADIPVAKSSKGEAKPFKGVKVDLHKIDPKDLTLGEYTENVSLVIHGPATRLYTKELKGMKAIYTPKLSKIDGPGWTIAKKHEDKITEFYERIQKGEIKVDVDQIIQEQTEKYAARSEMKSQSIKDLPTISGTNGYSNNKKYGKSMQTITYNVVTPRVGQKLTLMSGDVKVQFIVDNVSSYKGMTNEATIHPVADREKKSMIVVHKNKWQVWGYNEAHNIRFEM